jgi:RHS repeat-associated protein
VTTKANATQESRQAFDPWGKVRPGGTGTMPTKLNYTGQRKDDTGLLYYGARYYDPVVGRFTSPDSIVPGASSGLGGLAALWVQSKIAD